jgi:hypothetical protein
MIDSICLFLNAILITLVSKSYLLHIKNLYYLIYG